MLPELHLTKDHSHTLYVRELDETYHSRNGAIEEAMYVYIGRGLVDKVTGEESAPESYRDRSREASLVIRSLPRYPQLIVDSKDLSNVTVDHIPRDTADRGPITDSLSVLEIGFGTGLNAWLTAIECEKQNIQCYYHSMETFPLPVELTQQLNYTQNHTEAQQQLFIHLHQAIWNEPVLIHQGFTLCKQEVSLQNFEAHQTFDIIYFDAFAPEKQPELWTKDLFQKLYDCLNPNGIIVTYSSKGDIKRMWREIGFVVERLPGPPKKRHMLRGRKLRIDN